MRLCEESVRETEAFVPQSCRRRCRTRRHTLPEVTSAHTRGESARRQAAAPPSPQKTLPLRARRDLLQRGVADRHCIPRAPLFSAIEEIIQNENHQVR